jgi:dipeptidyl aminopeptidase/acylaminoacyl peptidase
MIDAVEGRARRILSAFLVAAAIGTFGCTSAPHDQAAPPRASATPASSAPTVSSRAPAPHLVSLPSLMQKNFNGRDLRVGRVLARNEAYTRYHVTYKSGSLTISGIMNVPRGSGPFPVLVLNHGYIDPGVYVNGQGLRREQDYLARRGFVVLHTDYRNHAQSDDDLAAELTLRLGYVEDAINAVEAIKSSSLPYLDRERVGMLGRSMGGGVTLAAAVVAPDLVDAVVVFAPVSSNYVDNFNRWIRRGPERRRLAAMIAARYGSPEENPAFWRNVSPVNFFDRIRVPVLIHHGTADESVPYAWTQKTLTALRRQDKDATLYTYPGEHHAFGPAWPTSMVRTVNFFREHLKT